MKLQLSIDYPGRIKRRELAQITQNNKKTKKMQMVKDTINSNEQQLQCQNKLLNYIVKYYIALYGA